MLPLPPLKPFVREVKRQDCNENRNMQCQQEREEGHEDQSHCLEYGHNTTCGRAKVSAEDADASPICKVHRPARASRCDPLELALGNDRRGSLAFANEASAQAQAGDNQR